MRITPPIGTVKSAPSPSAIKETSKASEESLNLDNFLSETFQKAIPQYLQECPKKILKLKGRGKKVPFLPFAVFQGIKNKESRIKGNRFLKRDFKAVEVELPDTVAQIAQTMGGIASLAVRGMANEYGLALYYGEKGGLRATVQRGGWLVTSVIPEPMIQFPDGESAYLLGLLSHTHPSGAPNPSSADFKAQSVYINSPTSELRYGVLSVPGGSWSFYDDREAHKLSPELAEQLPLEALFDPYWKSDEFKKLREKLSESEQA